MSETEELKEPLPTWKAHQQTRRGIVQIWQRLEKSVPELMDMRKQERRAGKLDNCQQITEAIQHSKLAITYLRKYAKCQFGKSLEELETYK